MNEKYMLKDCKKRIEEINLLLIYKRQVRDEINFEIETLTTTKDILRKIKRNLRDN